MVANLAVALSQGEPERVDSEAGETAYEAVIGLDEIAEGTCRGFVVNGWPVLVARAAGGVYAVLDRCTHAASTLSEGRIRRTAVCCPLHGALFDLASGRCVGGGLYKPLLTFPTRVEAGQISVAVPAEPPKFDQTPV